MDQEKDDRPRKMLTVDQVLQLVPVSKSTLFRMVKKGTFPPSHDISDNRTAWYEDELVDWQNSRPVNDSISRAMRRRR